MHKRRAIIKLLAVIGGFMAKGQAQSKPTKSPEAVDLSELSRAQRLTLSLDMVTEIVVMHGTRQIVLKAKDVMDALEDVR